MGKLFIPHYYHTYYCIEHFQLVFYFSVLVPDTYLNNELFLNILFNIHSSYII